MTPGSPTLGGLASVLCISVSSWEVSIYMSEVFQKALESKDNLWIHVFHHRGEDTWVESTDNMIQTPTPPQIYSRVRILLFCRKPDAAAGQRSQTQTERHKNRLKTTWVPTVMDLNKHSVTSQEALRNTVRDDYRASTTIWIFSVSSFFHTVTTLKLQKRSEIEEPEHDGQDFVVWYHFSTVMSLNNEASSYSKCYNNSHLQTKLNATSCLIRQINGDAVINKLQRS